MNQENQQAENQQTANQAGRDAISRNRSQVAYQYESFEEDEIDLTELIAVLFQRKIFIIGMTLIITFMAFGATRVLPEKFGCNAMIEIGQFYKSDNYQPVESIESVKNRLQGFGKMISFQMQQDNFESVTENHESLGFSVGKDFKIEVPKHGRILDLALQTQNREAGKDFLFLIIEKLIKEHKKNKAWKRINKRER